MIQLNKTYNSNVQLLRKLNSSRRVLGHKDKLKQVFYNLIINSYQAFEGQTNPVIEVSTVFEQGRVIARVRDNGCGMSEATMKRLFEPFHTTKKHGTGLGLATVHKIIETHEARIFVESEKNKGTEFTIEFQRLAEPTPGERLEDGQESSLGAKNSAGVGIMKKRGNG
jgi:two-component system sensor histidine kinase PilS (NtrC family)